MQLQKSLRSSLLPKSHATMRCGYALSELALQLRLRAVVMIFFGLCLILLWVVDVNSCASFQFFYIGSHANAGTLKPVKSQPRSPLNPEVCSCLSQSFRQMYVYVGMLCLILTLACMGHDFAKC